MTKFSATFRPCSAVLLTLQDTLGYALAACVGMAHAGESPFTMESEYQGFRGRQRALRDALEGLERASREALRQIHQESVDGFHAGRGVPSELSRIAEVAKGQDRRSSIGLQAAAQGIVEKLLRWGRAHHVDVACAVLVERPEHASTDAVDALRHAGGGVLEFATDLGTHTGASREARFPLGTKVERRTDVSWWELRLTTPNGAVFRYSHRNLALVGRAPNGPEAAPVAWRLSR